MEASEIVAPVDLCVAGRLNPAALGWARGPLHRCVIDGPWGRRKRWHHWGVTSAREVISMTLVDLDVVALAMVSIIDRSTRKIVRQVGARPLGLYGMELPERAGSGRVDATCGGVRLAFEDDGQSITLRARSGRVDVDVAVGRRVGHESLGVATAWPGTDGTRYAYSSKQTALPARGDVRVDGRRVPLADNAFACLDWGRGVWPRRTAWNWASAAGIIGGQTIGLNLGAQWTHGVNENAIVVDGRLEKVASDVSFEWDRRSPERPWRLRGEGTDVRLEPEVIDGAAVPGLGRLCIAFGEFRGRVGGVSVDGLFGWAEELRISW